MTSVVVLFGLLAVLVCALIVKLLRRSGGSTENAEGLLIEQGRRVQASADRVSYGSASMHNAPPAFRDVRRR